jgi:hypothetical protein
MVNAMPRLLYPLGKTQYPFYRRLGGPQGKSRWVQKISPPTHPLGFDPRTVQPVACPYTNYIILAHVIGIRLAVKLIRMDRIMILLSLNKFVVIVLLLRVCVFIKLILILQH